MEFTGTLGWEGTEAKSLEWAVTGCVLPEPSQDGQGIGEPIGQR